MSWLEMIIQTNWYAKGMQSDRGVMMTSISFYLDNLGNGRRVFANPCIQGVQTENQGGQTKKFFRRFAPNFL